MSELPSRVHRLIRPEVQAMQAYAVQPSAGLIKLDAMENPFVLPTALQEELGKRLGRLPLNRYPGARIDDLRAALAHQAGLPKEFGLILGNGSDELITLLSLACARPGAKVLSPEPCFVMYEVSARLQGLEFLGVSLTSAFDLDEPALLAAIEQHQPAMIYLACPNNPTANLFDLPAIQRIIEAAPGLVVLDEAYQPFASRNHLSLARQYGHVLVMRTLSKFGLAGVRLGYLMGPQAWIDQIDKVRPPYNISALNAEAALFALEYADEFAHQAQVICQERSRLAAALQAMGLKPFPSEANMILVQMPDAPAAFAGLQSRGVLVKNVSHQHPLLAHCLRLTVGTPHENDCLISALKDLL
ncbi:MAG: histidinol-phosphate transaminase [Burkholderiales bacterium]